MPDEFEDPSADRLGSPDRSYAGDGGERDSTLERAETELLGLDGVEGVGLGRTAQGDDAVLVYVRDDAAAARLPASVAGLPVIARRTGPITAY